LTTLAPKNWPAFAHMGDTYATSRQLVGRRQVDGLWFTCGVVVGSVVHRLAAARDGGAGRWRDHSKKSLRAWAPNHEVAVGFGDAH
jgi:hypothetical protein